MLVFPNNINFTVIKVNRKKPQRQGLASGMNIEYNNTVPLLRATSLLILYKPNNIENNTWVWEDMEFLFKCSTWYIS